jgi:ABC-type ATPase with predicted acetyltransferase domain
MTAVEELKLPEGEYLTLANVLKDEFNKVKREKEVMKRIPVKTKVLFFSEKGRKAMEIEVRERVFYKHVHGESFFPDSEWRIAVNGVDDELMETSAATARVARLYRLNRTTGVQAEGMRLTLEEFVKQLREEDKALMPGYDPDELDYSLPNVMGYLLGLYPN